MSSYISSMMASEIRQLFDGIGGWWSGAEARDFGMMALSIVVSAWFFTRYYAD